MNRMCRRSLLALAMSAAIGASGCKAQVPASTSIPDGYHLVWSDEFSRDGMPDPGKWKYDTHANKLLWWHNERQYYSDNRLENARVSNGSLIIEARKEALYDRADWAGQEYSSARLITAGKSDWTYGYFDIRAKLPCGRGTWPAIWLLSSTGKWPDDGEIDIMEKVGHEPNNIYSTLHLAGPNQGGQAVVADPCDAFHNYGLDWRRDSITFLIDGKVTYRADRNGRIGRDWPWDHPFYLILNVAVGGAWGAAKGINPDAFPARMEIDYVRVYQLSGSN